MSILDKVKSMVNDAPTVTGRVNVNFGALTVEPRILVFSSKGKPDKFTLKEFAKHQGKKNVDDIELGRGEQFVLAMSIAVKELNPNLSFDAVEREIAVQNSNKTSKDEKKWLLTDWSEIVEPSLIAVIGKNWMEKLVPEDGKPAPKPIYVAAEMVDSFRMSKDADGNPKNYGTFKFIQAFKNREDCEAARNERYGEPGADGSTSSGGGEVDDETLESVYNLYKSSKSNVTKTLKALSQDPFSIGTDDEAEAKRVLRLALEANDVDIDEDDFE